MDTIFAGQQLKGDSGSDLVIPLSVDHLTVVDAEPWNPFESGWETCEDNDGPLIPESYPDARDAELTNAELLRDAVRAALSAQLAGTIIGPSLLTEAEQDALNTAFDLAELADAGYERRAAELDADRARYAAAHVLVVGMSGAGKGISFGVAA